MGRIGVRGQRVALVQIEHGDGIKALRVRWLVLDADLDLIGFGRREGRAIKSRSRLRHERSGLRGPNKIAELLNRYVFGSALARFQDEVPQAL